jgi:hypothetical protein
MRWLMATKRGVLPAIRGAFTLLALLVAAVDASKLETMEETIDRLLDGYSARTNPTLGVAQRSRAAGDACIEPAPNNVTVQVHVVGLKDINQKAGTYYIDGFLRQWWNVSSLPQHFSFQRAPPLLVRSHVHGTRTSYYISYSWYLR